MPHKKSPSYLELAETILRWVELKHELSVHKGTLILKQQLRLVESDMVMCAGMVRDMVYEARLATTRKRIAEAAQEPQ